MEKNLIDGETYCDAFVYRTEGGFQIGDRDNLEFFHSLRAAIRYCNGAILKSRELTEAREHYEDNLADNLAAAFLWHCDAVEQKKALLKFAKARGEKWL